jgi:hypothetical protein
MKITTSFLERMAARSHKIENLTPLLHKAAAAIDKKLFTSYLKNAEPSSENLNSSQKSLYFHWKYHPHGITNSMIRHH